MGLLVAAAAALPSPPNLSGPALGAVDGETRKRGGVLQVKMIIGFLFVVHELASIVLKVSDVAMVVGL